MLGWHDYGPEDQRSCTGQIVYHGTCWREELQVHTSSGSSFAPEALTPSAHSGHSHFILLARSSRPETHRELWIKIFKNFIKPPFKMRFIVAVLKSDALALSLM